MSRRGLGGGGVRLHAAPPGVRWAPGAMVPPYVVGAQTYFGTQSYAGAVAEARVAPAVTGWGQRAMLGPAFADEDEQELQAAPALSLSVCQQPPHL